jgi:hypothetical protein
MRISADCASITLAPGKPSVHHCSMPKWAWGLIIVLILLIWVVPNPAAAGAAVGNAFQALIIFFRSIGSAAVT